MSKQTTSFFSFLVGGVCGLLLGVLYAPQKGTHTRSQLTFQLDRFRNTLTDFLQDVSRGKVRLTNKAKNQGDEVMQHAKKQAEELLGDVDALIDKIQ